ncbi:MAG TPA: pyruvate kinase [Phycisphaerales bacterium]|nr:pyruvate kinase [Phycisphaerales bacterium]
MASPATNTPRDSIPETQAPSILATIVATIGPASESPDMVRRLIEAGVGIFRFNFSHGSFADHERRLKTVRQVAAEMQTVVACLGDLQGPKIRVGLIPAGVGQPSPSGGGMIDVAAGQDVILKAGIKEAFMRPNPAAPGGAEPVLPVTYEPLITEVEPGHKVLINDGAVRMLAVERDLAARELRCRVTVGGLISSKKGINLPQTALSAPAITERDWECVAWAVQHGLDFLALSFVRTADEVMELKQRLSELCPLDKTAQPNAAQGSWIPVIAKIEMPQAVANLDKIVDAADGIMVARGDLGVEMDIAKVPVVQKQILAACDLYGKPCIVATQMLETMIESSTPTRAEASDVANAIYDGADAVMLSAETATGKHPALVVETMARIIACTEAQLRSQPLPATPPSRLSAAHRGTAALAHGAWSIARDLNAKLVACWSENGGTARYLSQNRFNIPILAYSSSEHATRRMLLLRGVTPVCCKPPGAGTLSEWNAAVDEYVLKRNLAAKGDAIVLLAGRPLGKAKATNTIAIHKVGEATGYTAHSR